MSTINRSSSEPLYKQIERYLRNGIDEGLYAPGQRLPSIRSLSESLGVNHVTVRQAVNNLAMEGLVASNQGRGTFVKTPSLRGSGLSLIVPNLGLPLSAATSRGVSSVAREHGIDVRILDSHNDPSFEIENLERVLADGTRGMILYSVMGSGPAHAILRLVLEGFPIVLIDRYFEDIPTWYCAADNLQGGYLATSHLLERGRRRIAFISDVAVSSTRQRYEGYRQALAEHGIRLDGRLVRTNADPMDETCEATRELLARQPRPDAIFYHNDIRALRGMLAIKAAGLKVPDDIAVVGFDDIPMVALSHPPLTTVRQDSEAMGRCAVELFLEQLAWGPERRKTETKSKIVPVQLICRESS